MDIQLLLNDNNIETKLSISNRKNIDKIRKELSSKSVKYTESSIDFVLNGLNRSFEDTIEYTDENLKTIYQCGLPSHTREDALEIMSNLRKKGITYREQHQIMIYLLKQDHFFIDRQSRKNYLNLIEALAMK